MTWKMTDDEQYAARVVMAKKQVYFTLGLWPNGVAMPTDALADAAEGLGMWAHAALLRDVAEASA